MPIERIVGIDFGTSTSLIKVKAYRDGAPVNGDPTVTNYVEFDGQYWTPTLIRFAGTEEYYGYETKNLIPNSVLYKNFKLDLESSDAAAKAQAQELTQKFFRFLYERYSEQTVHFGQLDIERTLVSYPAKWKQETRDFMVQVAKEAGFQNVSGLDEPTAALYAVMVQESKRLVDQRILTPDKPSYVLMIDMGAGTTDLALCQYTPGGRNRIIDTWPPADSKVLFGGREMDELLLQYVADYLRQCGVSNRYITDLGTQYMEACKSWKEDVVSRSLRSGRSAPYCNFVNGLLMMPGVEQLPFPAITRTVLEKYCRDYISRYAELIVETMAHAQQVRADFNAGDLALAVLTGGHSQWYFARDMLCCTLPGYESGAGVRLMPNQVVNLSQPQGTVSSGLVFSPMFTKSGDGNDNPFKSLDDVDIFGTFFGDISGEKEQKAEKKVAYSQREEAGKKEIKQEPETRPIQETGPKIETEPGQSTRPKQKPDLKQNSEAVPARQSATDAALNEKISRYVYMTAKSRADAACALKAAGGDLKAALDDVYGAIMNVPDEAYINWLMECVRGASRVEGETLNVLKQAVPLLPGEVPYICRDITALGKGKDLQFFTSQRWLHVEKKMVRGFVLTEKLEFNKIASFFRYGAWLMFIKKPIGFKGFLASSFKDTEFVYRIHLGLYLRWRKQNGMDPYNMKITDAPKGFKPEE